jgi:plasmid stabilization system protein ParE
MVQRLYKASLDLAQTATNYQRVPHPLYREVRRRVVGPYNIVYSVAERTVDVLFIAHGARNFRRLLYPFE